MAYKYIIGLFSDDQDAVHAVEKIRAKGEKIHDVLSPFPVHGMEKALGLKESRLHIAGFCFGAFGTTFALSFMAWVRLSNWPLNYAGKPHFALPALVPIIFEFTVLCASFGMVFSWLVRNRMYPGKDREMLEPRTTDDKFGIVFDIRKSSAEDISRITSLLNETGAEEVKTRELKRRY